MKVYSKNCVWIVIFLFLGCAVAWAEEFDQLMNAAVDIAAKNDLGGAGASGALSGLTSSFSMWDIVGGLIFGSVGFVAFIYGKKNARFKPMMIGLALMAYPYFVHGTVGCVVGALLTASLYFFRD